MDRPHIWFYCPKKSCPTDPIDYIPTTLTSQYEGLGETDASDHMLDWLRSPCALNTSLIRQLCNFLSAAKSICASRQNQHFQTSHSLVSSKKSVAAGGPAGGLSSDPSVQKQQFVKLKSCE